MAIAEEGPDETPQKIDHHHIAEQDMDAFKRHLSFGREAERLVIENEEAGDDEPEHCERVDPMKPARRRIPR